MRWIALVTVASGAVAFAACQRQGASANTAALTPVPTTAASALPPAPPSMAELAYAPRMEDLRERRSLRFAYAGAERRYAYLDDAYWIDDVYGEAPPDYAFDYDDTGPVVWLDGDYVVCIGEPVDDGVRFYYYEPGEEWPFFVQDPDYGYGFDNGVLSAVYDGAGRPLAPDIARSRLRFASRYFARGQALQMAAREGDRRQVSLAAWQTDARAFAARRSAWDGTLAHNQAWQLYHADHRPQESTRWGPQREWRIAEAQVARSSVQQAGRAGGGVRQAALDRTYRDERALIDHQVAASQAAEDQLAHARAFAGAQEAERGGRQRAVAASIGPERARVASARNRFEGAYARAAEPRHERGPEAGRGQAPFAGDRGERFARAAADHGSPAAARAPAYLHGGGDSGMRRSEPRAGGGGGGAGPSRQAAGPARGGGEAPQGGGDAPQGGGSEKRKG